MVEPHAQQTNQMAKEKNGKLHWLIYKPYNTMLMQATNQTHIIVPWAWPTGATWFHRKQRLQNVSHLLVAADPRRLCQVFRNFGSIWLELWKRQGSKTWPKDKNSEDAAGLSGITNHHCITFASPPKSRSRSSPYLPSSSPAGGGRKLRCCKPASSRCVHLSAPKHHVSVVHLRPWPVLCRANQ